MAIKSQHCFFTFHPIELHLFLSKLYKTNSLQTRLRKDKALSVSDLFCDIHEIKFKKKLQTKRFKEALTFVICSLTSGKLL